MDNSNSFYGFLKDLITNKDGSYDYNITERILEKYNDKKDSYRKPKSTIFTNSIQNGLK